MLQHHSTTMKRSGMSGQYTNHSRSLPSAASSSRVWSHLSSTVNEGVDAHTSLSGALLNEASFYTQPNITCTPHLPVQPAHTKSSVNWHTPSLLANAVESSLPKTVPPLFSLQMLVDNRQNQMKNMSDKKDSFDLPVNVEIPDAHIKSGQISQMCFNSRIVDKSLDNDSLLATRTSNNECNLLDNPLVSSLSSTSQPLLTNCNSVNSFNLDKDTISKITSLSYDSKMDTNSINHDKIIENNAQFLQRGLNFSSELIIEKITDKKESEAPRDTEGSSVIMQMKNVIPSVMNLASKSEKCIKEELQDFSSDYKKKMNEYNIKASKNFAKKGKKGVDSLLEKVESCNKKLCNSENFGTTSLIAHVEEKDTNSIRSTSPEYYKTRSPNNREDDVVSPSFSNEDSNDTKQRRKRKLGKPIRLAKDLKLEHEDTELEGMKSKLSTNSTETNEVISNELLLQSSLLSMCSQKNENQKRQFEAIHENKVKIFSNDNAESSDVLKISNFGNEKSTVLDNSVKDVEMENSNNLIQDKKSGNLKTNMGQYVIQTLKETPCTRTRRSSECSIGSLKRIKKIRRRSCDNIRDLQHESISKTKVPTNIVFNEVESQLEKMFEGIIETDKDLLKNTIINTEKSGTLLSDDEQKENLDSDKVKTSRTSNSLSSDTTNNDGFKNKKKKNLSKMRSHKKKPTNSSKDVSDDKKGQLLLKKSKKQNNLKKKKKDVKIDNFREAVCDSSITTSSTKFKGPVIQMKGPKSNPVFIQIVNVSREDDEEKNKEKRKSIGNGPVGRSKRLNYQNNLDYLGKSYNVGLFNSTLSIRYDAHTADETWICVFCKRGPHFIIPGDSNRPHPNVSGPHIVPGSYTVPAGVLSDLFGPYLIGKNVTDDSVMSPDEQEITKEQKQGNKNKRSLRHAGLADQFVAKVSKRKRKFSSNVSNVYMGMTMINGDEHRWEVWLHEQCIVWAAGVYITGGRLSGLQDAVWDAAKSICDSCGLTGANIACIKRGCKATTHYCCALTAGWHLDIDQYMPKCNIHRVT